MPATVVTVRPRPPILRALGRDDPPVTVVVDGCTYTRVDILKHDSWAATAIYAGDGPQLLCKFNRTQPAVGVNLRWLGRRLGERERRFLARLASIPNVPRAAGPVVVDGRVWPNAMARHFLPGRPLLSGERVSDRFFPELLGVLRAMHSLGIAYVDLHKRENILVGEDGRPFLIDFQISFDSHHPRVRWLPGAELVFDYLASSDLYHLRKHITRHRPDQMAELFPDQSAEPPWWIRAHRTVAVPFRSLRRRLLRKARVRGESGMASTEHFPEDVLRHEAARKAA